MTPPVRLHVNGKWLAQRVTGTQRYATEVVRAIIATESAPLVLHVPAGAVVPEWLQESELVDVRRAPVAGVLFEQIYLPIVSAGHTLLNFAGPAPIMKRRQLVTMHDAAPFRWPQTYTKAFVAFYRVMYTLLGRWAQQLVTVSHFSARELNDVLRIPLSRFVVAGCSADALSSVVPVRPDLDVSHPFYLVVGTLAVHKNLPAPVQALVASGRSVVVVGASGDRQAFSQSSTMPQGTVIAGHLDDSELAWLYQNARALIFPSKYEGFGLPPLEAQKLGCPVVTSFAAALPEVVAQAGLYFDPDDPATLIEALDTLECDESLAQDLRRRGLANAQRYSWHDTAVAVLESVGVSVPSRPDLTVPNRPRRLPRRLPLRA
ncbi:glycosyl transferase family 1 [Mycobacterium antarcticum]|uniref:glycosyltransferase family 4 protein n=1 Tax=Mycolicibacterium sp. TUM20985 TaxID=3023370 RepID=UPI002572BAD8|nr:glycosyltransferase family 1 protein [Mycolicibacterium sp. TUM20985]BDX34501.1 glycosyl transferase family 1 [Mycolicibacterium sp. TUM20985]